MRLPKALLTVLLTVGFLACKKESTIKSEIPEISNLEQSARTINIGIESEDTLLFRFRFQDGDADIKGGRAKVVFKNVLDTVGEVDYPFPEISAELDPSKGVSGIALVSLDAAAILFQITDTSKKSDIQVYDIFMVDNAGHKSNVLRSDSVLVTN